MASHLFDLSGSRAVVVGGTSGLAREIALGLARAGVDVVASSRRAEQVTETLEELHARTLREFGKVDVLVNAAGSTARLPTMECTEEQWQQIFA